jgi:VanZ family protein
VLFSGFNCSFAQMSRRFMTHWLPLLLWMGVIFGASTRLGSPENTSLFVGPILVWLDPNISEEAIDFVHHCLRKTAHAVEYAILGFLIWRIVQSASALASQRPARHFRLALLLAALYAATDETHQIFVPGREAAVGDVLLDTYGAGLGLAMTWWAMQRRKSK